MVKDESICKFAGQTQRMHIKIPINSQLVVLRMQKYEYYLIYANKLHKILEKIIYSEMIIETQYQRLPFSLYRILNNFNAKF